jgi:hypothetical protein
MKMESKKLKRTLDPEIHDTPKRKILEKSSPKWNNNYQKWVKKLERKFPIFFKIHTPERS